MQKIGIVAPSAHHIGNAKSAISPKAAKVVQKIFRCIVGWFLLQHSAAHSGRKPRALSIARNATHLRRSRNLQGGIDAEWLLRALRGASGHAVRMRGLFAHLSYFRRQRLYLQLHTHAFPTVSGGRVALIKICPRHADCAAPIGGGGFQLVSAAGSASWLGGVWRAAFPKDRFGEQQSALPGRARCGRNPGV